MADQLTSRVESSPRRRLRRLGAVFALMLLALAVLVWFLPAIVASTSLKDSFVQAAVPDFRGRIVLGELSLGWLSPVQVRNLSIRDEQGEPLAEAAAVTTGKTLWALLCDSRNVGEIELLEPVLYAAVRSEGSNLEDALVPLQGESSGVSCVVKIVEGRCILRDEATKRESSLTAVHATIAIPADSQNPFQAELAAKLSAEGAAGDLKIDGKWRPVATTFGIGQATIQMQGVPLDALAPILTRCGVSAELSGIAHVRGEVALGDDGRQSIRLEQGVVENLSARSTQWLGGDVLRLARLEAAGHGILTNESMELRETTLACDAGKVQLSGATRRQVLSATQFLTALRGSTFDAAGELDLARLAQMLPRTLRLREGLTVTSGVVRFACATKDHDNARRREGSLEASSLAAEHQGRRITWERPLSATFIVRDDPAGPTIEQLACESDFVRIQGRGSLAEGSVSLEGDLSKLAAELQRFVDLGAMQFGGAVQGDLQWRREGDRTAAQGELQLTDFQWTVPGRRPWREPQLAAGFSAHGIVDQNGVRRIDQGQVELAAGNDSALVRLTAPVESLSEATAWPVQCEARGELASWLPRLENFVASPDWSLEGRMTLAAAGAVSRTHAHLENVAATVDSLYLQGPGLTIRESRVEMQADLTWNGATQSISIRQATGASGTVSFRAQNVSVNLAPENLAAAGDVDFRGDLQRVSQWFDDPRAPPVRRIAGMTVGRVHAETSDRGVTLQGAADVENFGYAIPENPASGGAARPVSQATAWKTLWQEPRSRITYHVTYMASSDSLDVQQATIAGDAFQVNAQGKIAEATAACRVDLSGQYDCDLAKLIERLRPWVGLDLKMTGRGPRAFTVKGPLFDPAADSSEKPASGAPLFVSPELSGKTSLAWTSAEYCGVKTGAGQAPVELKAGIVSLGPLDLPVSEGRLTAAPKLLLNAAPMALALDAGPVLSNVRISPAMCRSWIKYVAPLVADATQAEGRFSVELTQPARVALDDPTRGEVRGALQVHTAQVGPGPLSRQVLTLADQVKAAMERQPFTGGGGSDVWLQLPEQSLPFEMAGGRVYHRDLTVTAKDVAIRTRGSVGLDQTLDLLAEVPVQDRWVEREPLLAGFRGQTLQVPMTGTLAAPRLDPRGVENFAKQLLGGAAQRLLEENLKAPPEVQRALDRLFRRP